MLEAWSSACFTLVEGSLHCMDIPFKKATGLRVGGLEMVYLNPYVSVKVYHSSKGCSS